MGADWSFFDRGFSLFPLLPHSKIPAVKFWAPFKEQRAAPEQIAIWANQRDYNSGVATGIVSGVIVLDCDNPMAKLACERRGLPVTLTVGTPRGDHLYFQHPGWPIHNRVGLTWEGWSDLGVDIRGDGGFVVGPGSYFVPTAAERAKGKVEGHYRITVDAPIAPLPDWLAEMLWPKPHEHVRIVPVTVAEETSAYGRAAMTEVLNELSAVQDGAKSNQIWLTTVRIAELVAGGEITEEEGWGGLHEILAVLGLEDEDKANGTVARAWAKGFSNPKAAPERQGGPVAPEQALGVRLVPAPPPTKPAAGIAPPPPAPVEIVDGDDIFIAVDQPVEKKPFGPYFRPRYVGGNEVVNYFAGVVFIARTTEMFIPCGVKLGRPAFDALYAGPGFLLDVEASGTPERSAWAMFNENRHVAMPKVFDICFRPKLPPGQILEIEGIPYLNTYVPVKTPRMAGDASRFVEHVRKMLPFGQDAEILLHWMASAIQNPGEKFDWWPVIQGVKGNGKTLLMSVMMAAIGERYSHLVRADALLKTGNQFNDWIVGKLFLGFEEIKSADGKRDFVEMMKDTVTNRRLATEGKGKGQTTSDNCANGMMLTNHKGACPVDDEERRWCILFCAQQRISDLARDGMSGSYFPDLYKWLNSGGYAVVTDFLATMPLDPALDPAGSLRRAPATTSTPEAIKESKGLIEQEIEEAIDGRLPGFRGGVITSVALKSLLDRMRKIVAPQRYRQIMENVGYFRHPVLEGNKFRPFSPLFDGSRPVLYFEYNSPILKLTDTSEIIAETEKTLRGEMAERSNVVPFKR